MALIDVAAIAAITCGLASLGWLLRSAFSRPIEARVTIAKEVGLTQDDITQPSPTWRRPR